MTAAVNKAPGVAGLGPWLDGDLPELVMAFGAWIDAAGPTVDALISIKHRGYRHGRPDLDCRPSLTVFIDYREGSIEGHASVKLWEGTPPEDFVPALDLAVERARRQWVWPNRSGGEADPLAIELMPDEPEER